MSPVRCRPSAPLLVSSEVFMTPVLRLSMLACPLQACRRRSDDVIARSPHALTRELKARYDGADDDQQQGRVHEDGRRVQTRVAEGSGAYDRGGFGRDITNRVAASWGERRSVGDVSEEAPRWPQFAPRGSGGPKAGRNSLLSSGRVRAPCRMCNYGASCMAKANDCAPPVTCITEIRRNFLELHWEIL